MSMEVREVTWPYHMQDSVVLTGTTDLQIDGCFTQKATKCYYLIPWGMTTQEPTCSFLLALTCHVLPLSIRNKL